jgi:hypothetical protein
MSDLVAEQLKDVLDAYTTPYPYGDRGLGAGRATDALYTSSSGSS